LEKTMNMNQWWVVLAAAVLILGGCPAEEPVKSAGLEQKIEAARTRADHQEIAAAYEQQAGVDREAMERHHKLARAYEQGWVWAPPRAGGVSSGRRENKSLIAHCENLARMYQQAAEENLALAKQHRQIAAETKD
jgi:hypothetical protein